MKIFAFYLPQFHAIKENNEWWGNGFTEWTNVRKTQALFKNHNQPRVPLNDNYYDLTQVESLQWQASLVKDYRVDGLCFYHYWFNGKMLLEKPAELLLENTQIDLPFFFSWANEPWTRNWDGENKKVLMPQEYGSESEWKQHFEYLLPFFQDKRYIRHNGHPIFVLYRSASFGKCPEWIAYWRQLAQEHGLGNIHFVNSLTAFDDDSRDLGFNAELHFEPFCGLKTTNKKLRGADKFKHSALKRMNKIKNLFSNPNLNTIKTFDYDEAWQIILKKDYTPSSYPGAFVDWDNTPRRQENGTVFLNTTPEKFKRYLSALYKKAEVQQAPYIFINAWNEWAEGTYLEPDTKYEYQYLEAIKAIKEQD